MKKAICFFCDISGTLNGTNKNNDIDYQNLNSNLLLLMKKFEAEYLFFSLVSSDQYNIVNDTKEKLEKQFNSPIVFKKQFFENGYILDDIPHYKQSCKTEQIMNLLDKIEKEFDIQRITYADDCEMFHDMIALLTEEKSYHHKIISIIPQKKEGLSELNQLLYKNSDQVVGYFVTYLIIEQLSDIEAQNVELHFKQYKSKGSLSKNKFNQLPINQNASKTISQKISYPFPKGERLKIPVSICKNQNSYTMDLDECYYLKLDSISIEYKNKYPFSKRNEPIRDYAETNVIIDGEVISGKGSA